MSLVNQGFIGRDSSANETLFRLSTEKERGSCDYCVRSE